MRLVLPYPPSVNHYWRSYRGRVVLVPSKAAPSARTSATSRPPPLLWAATARASRRRAGGSPWVWTLSRRIGRRAATSTTCKSAARCWLEHAGVYEDDSQIDPRYSLDGGRSLSPGRIEVQIDEFPLSRCPLCQGPYPPTDPFRPEDN
ncbi:MAG: hypothetical protein R3C45_18500 [Phycisphaerales bacterium]